MTAIERLLHWVDDRLGTAHFVSHSLRKAFPDHWSFMLGEINVYAFGVLVATGTFLAFFFEPDASKLAYHGPYVLLDGVQPNDVRKERDLPRFPLPQRVPASRTKSPERRAATPAGV